MSSQQETQKAVSSERRFKLLSYDRSLAERSRGACILNQSVRHLPAYSMPSEGLPTFDKSFLPRLVSLTPSRGLVYLSTVSRIHSFIHSFGHAPSIDTRVRAHTHPAHKERKGPCTNLVDPQPSPRMHGFHIRTLPIYLSTSSPSFIHSVFGHATFRGHAPPRTPPSPEREGPTTDPQNPTDPPGPRPGPRPGHGPGSGPAS